MCRGGLVRDLIRHWWQAVEDADKVFRWADQAVIKGNTVEVASSTIASPVAVRYGWASNPPCNLYNKDGLPASPFRTDTW
jgi:sialate O-acetylesterase